MAEVRDGHKKEIKTPIKPSRNKEKYKKTAQGGWVEEELVLRVVGSGG